MFRKLPFVSAPLFAGIFMASPAWAADNPAAHEHGHARLQMAVEENRIDLILTSPAHNLAGFEHKAKNAEQEQKLASVRQWLTDTPLIEVTSNTCNIDSVQVSLGGEDESDHGHHGHHHDEEHGHHDDDHHHGDEHHHEGEEHEHGHHHDDHDEHHETHRDYEVSQQLTCEKSLENGEFSTPLLDEFPELKELDVEWVSPQSQGSLTIEAADMVFTTDN